MTDYTKWVGFDVETAGELPEYALQPYRLARGQASVTSYATAWFAPDNPDKLVTDAVAEPTVEDYRQLLNTAYEQGLTLVGWNVAFDAAWLVAAGLREEVLRCDWLDGMLLWQHLEREPEYEMSAAARRPWGLKAAVEKYYPAAAGYDEGVDFQDMSPEAVAKRLTYNRMDAQFALALARSFHQQLRERSPRQLRNAMIERAAIPMVADSMVQGLVVDRDAAEDLGQELQALTGDLLKQLEAEGATDKVLRSPVQLRKLLYETWGMPIEHYTDKGAPSTDKVALHYLSLDDPRPQLVKDYREALGNYKKFVENVIASADYNEDGKTRPTMRIYGTYTGRATFASKQGRGKAERQTGFAIHQMKNDKRYRNIIAAPEGFLLCELDAAGQEFRWMAEESGDETMRSLCMPGEDPHSYMGASIIHMDYHRMMELKEIDDEAKHGRKMGKVGNLSCQFRIGWKKLRLQANVQFGMPIGEREAQHIHKTYHSTYPGVKQYWNRQTAKCRRLGYAETLAGRRVQLKGSWTSQQTGWKLESTAVNFPIQGIGADQKYLAIKVMSNLLPQMGGYFYFELHDGIYFLLPEKTARRDALVLQQALNNLPYQRAWGFTPSIPFPWDLKIGTSWGNMKEVTE